MANIFCVCVPLTTIPAPMALGDGYKDDNGIISLLPLGFPYDVRHKSEAAPPYQIVISEKRYKKKNVSNARFNQHSRSAFSMYKTSTYERTNQNSTIHNPIQKKVTDSHARGCPVAEWEADGEGSTVAKTFSLFLERFRNELLSGRCEYVESVGVVEKLSPSPPRGK